jgi:hypothetical protein
MVLTDSQLIYLAYIETVAILSFLFYKITLRFSDFLDLLFFKIRGFVINKLRR